MNLQNEIETALNTVHVALVTAADYARDSEGIAEDPALVTLLRGLRARRAEQAAVLEQHIRKVGLPRMPDPERQLIGRSITHLKSALSLDRHRALVQAQQDCDREIVNACSAALDVDVPEETRQLLNALVKDVLEHKPDLARLTPAE